MPISIFNKDKQKTVAILDIGSASVGGAIVVIKEGADPQVLFSVRDEMVFQKDLNLERFTSAMLQSLGVVLNKIEKYEGEKPRDFFCTLSSPWYESKTKIININENKNFIVTEKFLEEIIRKESNIFSSSINSVGNVADLVAIIDMKNIQIKLNGYETPNPYGKIAKNMDIALFMGLGSKKVIENIKSKISKIFYVKNITFSTFSLVAFSTVRDIFTDKNNFIILDVTGEVTDMSLVEDNILVKSTTFPLGKNFITRRIASEMNTTPEEANSLFNMFSSNKINNNTKGKLSIILNDVQKEWISEFAKNTISMSKNYAIPSTLFFTSDLNVSNWLIEALENKKLPKNILTDNMFDVHFLSEKILEKFCLFKKEVKKDTFIALEAIYLNKSQDII